MIAAQRGEFGEEERKGQKEISLGDDLEGPVRYVLRSWSGRTAVHWTACALRPVFLHACSRGLFVQRCPALAARRLRCATRMRAAQIPRPHPVPPAFVPPAFVPPASSAELYKNYLMYSMSGDVVELPVGGVIRKKTSLVTRQVGAGGGARSWPLRFFARGRRGGVHSSSTGCAAALAAALLPATAMLH